MGQVFQLRDIQIIKLNYLHKSHTYVAGRFLLLFNFVHLKSYHEEHLSQQTHKFSSSAEYSRPHFGHSASDSLPSRASSLRSSSTSTSSGPSPTFFACSFFFFSSSFSFFLVSLSQPFSPHGFVIFPSFPVLRPSFSAPLPLSLTIHRHQ